MDQINQPQNIKPAGFWIRFLAYVIDSIVVTIVNYAILIPMALMMPQLGILETGQNLTALLVNYGISAGVFLAYAIYFYTQKGGTLGKLAFNMRVVDQQTGTKMTWIQVILREFIGKFLSAIVLMIGFIIAGVRSDKRALHDLMVGTQVLRKV